MLTIIYGNDREKGRKKFHLVREEALLRGGAVSLVEEGQVNNELFERMTAAQGLFDIKNIFILNGVLEKKAEQELLEFWSDSLAQTGNEIIVYEPTLAKVIVSELEAKSIPCVQCALPTGNDKSVFNIFVLSDALGSRNKKELWVLYHEALGSGFSPEEISGTLFWSLKNIALMYSAGGDAGLSPFVARKARGFAKNYTKSEVKKYSRALTDIYHEAHKGDLPLDIGLEKFILGL